MRNIFNWIKGKISKHKRVSILVLLLFLLIGGTIGYVLVTNSTTNSNPKVIQTNNQNKNPDTNATGSKDDKKNEDKKSDDKKKDDKESDEKKTDVKPEATVAPSNDVTVEETNNTTSNNISNNTSTTTNNTTSNSTSNNNKPAPCVPTYTTVTHPAVGHYEQREIMPAYNKPIYAERIVGLVTGRIYNSLDEFYAQDEDGNYTVTQVQVGTEYVPAVYDNVWVEDQPAYTTTEASGC